VVQRAFDDALRGGRVGDAVCVDHGFAAGRADLRHHRVGRRGAAAFACRRGTDVVDDDLRTVRGQREREVASDAAAGARDHHDLAFHELVHANGSALFIESAAILSQISLSRHVALAFRTRCFYRSRRIAPTIN
jgi:hypothetical protein